MLMTPDEASKCECPLIRYCENIEAVIHSGQGAIHSHVNCRGPDCKIGWRWASSLTVNNPGRIPGAGQQINSTHGYCGFAGRPD